MNRTLINLVFAGSAIVMAALTFAVTGWIDNALGVVTLLFAAYVFNRGARRQRTAEMAMVQFKSLVHNTDDFIAIGSPDRFLRYLNPTGREMIGATDAIIGSRTSQMYDASENERLATEIIPVVLSHGRWQGEIKYRHLVTGEVIPVRSTIISLRDDEGTLIGLAIVARDLRHIRKLEQQLDVFFGQSLDMLAIANTEGYFLRMNPAFTDVLGFSVEELCSRHSTEFIHPDDVQRTIETIKGQMDGRPVFSFENRYRTKEGGYRWLSWKSIPHGDVTFGAARDVTEEKLQREQIENLSREAIAASQAKSQFLANMSHEIRTPINGVVGMTTLLLDTPLNEEQREFAETIKTSTDALMTVINDILDFSKVEAGKLEIENVDFHLSSLIDDTARGLSWALRNKSLPFTLDSEAPVDQRFNGDPGRIRQVLINLLGNAIKFTSRGSIRLEVRRVRAENGRTVFRFAVHDSGIGISSEEQKRLFLPFTQADSSTARKFGGTGLGLSICHKLVELMGGEIGVVSQPGAGSTFWFTLPLKDVAGVAPFVIKSKTQSATAFPNAQILVAEDNIVNQKIVLTMLAKMGFRAQAVANGNEVLAALHDRHFDLILMDCQMPELDGFETTRRVRASHTLPNPRVPIVAMTANALKGDRERCLEAGMDDYTSKPVALEDLAAIIETWLLRSRAA